jgi:serine/threonine protein kinase
LEKLVGKGGMGEVHRAVQLSLGRVVAVKVLNGELASDPTFVARFDKEAAALATLSHPNVVSIVDKGKAEGTYYLVMEFVDGPSLREMMRSPVLDLPGALRIIMEIARAIDYAHSRGVVHRDLKPENILFDEQAGGLAKVTDFGLATFYDDSKLSSRFNVTETHVSMGTLSYMAPEQRVDAKNADHRADIYSLGVMLYELLVGEVPIGTFDPPSQRRPGTDRRLDAIVLRCLKPAATDRYQRVADLMLDLEPMAPVSFSQVPRKISRVEQLKNQIRQVFPGWRRWRSSPPRCACWPSPSSAAATTPQRVPRPARRSPSPTSGWTTPPPARGGSWTPPPCGGWCSAKGRTQCPSLPGDGARSSRVGRCAFPRPPTTEAWPGSTWTWSTATASPPRWWPT